MTGLGFHPLGPFAAYSSWIVELAVLGGVIALFVALGARRSDLWADRLLTPRGGGRGLAVAVVLVTLAVCLGVAALVLERFPNSADEYGDLFLAETLSRGRLWNEIPEHAEFFSVIHIGQKDGKWVARFPPGWPAVLALGGLLRLPAWALNPLIAALTLALLYRFAERFVGRGAGPIAAALMAVSGFFVFTSASYRSHGVAAFWILAGAYLLARYVEASLGRHALLSGLAFGLAFATRPYTALLCALPVLSYLVAQRHGRALGPLGLMALGAVPGVAGLLLYNHAVTGDPFVLVTTWLDPGEGLGFRYGHTAWIGAVHAARRLGAFVEWTNPALLFVFVACAVRLFRARPWGLFAWISLVLPALAAGHFFYHAFGGTQYGPRFYYEAYPFVVLVVVHGVVHRSPAETGAALRWSRRALLAGWVFAACTLPFTALRLNGVVSERQDLFDLVRRQGLHNAVVFIASPTGRTWPMPVQDLLRNGTQIGGDVIYAHDRGGRNALLREAYPGRAHYRYVRDPASARGTLERQ